MEVIYIYTLKNSFTNEIRYVGKTNNPIARQYSHYHDKNNTHKGKWSRKLIKEGGKPILEILDVVPKQEWEYWEKYWIAQFKAWGFNLVNGNEGGQGAAKVSDKTKELISRSRIGKKWSIESRIKLSNAKMGKPSNKKNFYRSPESRLKTSLKNKGLKRTKEMNDKIGEIWRKKSKLTDAQLIEVYELGRKPKISQDEIAALYGIKGSQVSNIVNRKCFVKFLTEYEEKRSYKISRLIDNIDWVSLKSRFEEEYMKRTLASNPMLYWEIADFFENNI